SLIETKLGEAAETIRVRREQGLEPARAIVLEHQGKRTMDAIRALVTRSEQAEARHRDELSADLDARMQSAIVSLVASTAIGVCVVVLGLYLVQREVRARRQLAEQLQAADRNKNAFLALLGHELRNPLAAVRNAVDVFELLGPLPEG